MPTPSTKAPPGMPPGGSAALARRRRRAGDASGLAEAGDTPQTGPGANGESPSAAGDAGGRGADPAAAGLGASTEPGASTGSLQQEPALSTTDGTLKEATLVAAVEDGTLPPIRSTGEPVSRPKRKLVRDSFTMPQSDFELIERLKQRAVGLQRPAKKSELLRAGLQALVALDAEQLKQALDALEPLKPGRPKKAG